MTSLMSQKDERAGADIVRGPEACYKHSMELIQELGFPKGILPLKDLEECGWVRKTGYVWMKARKPYEHYFEGNKTLVSYALEVTAYVEKFKMKKINGIKSKQMIFWVPVCEMSINELDTSKIRFETPMGIGKSFPITAYMTDDEKAKYLKNTKK